MTSFKHFKDNQDRDILIKLYEEYIEFLNEANKSPTSLAHIHGWKCPQEEILKGEDFRKKIQETKNSIK